jgi:hypothetical protein
MATNNVTEDRREEFTSFVRTLQQRQYQSKVNQGKYPTIGQLNESNVQSAQKQKEELLGKWEGDVFGVVWKFIDYAVQLAGKPFNREYKVDKKSINFLVSFPGCGKQELHTDYDYKTAEAFDEEAKGGGPPLFMISPLGQSAKLKIAKGPPAISCHNSLYFNPQHKPNVDDYSNIDDFPLSHYSLLVMHGYTAHAGCAYDKCNVRLHFYVVPTEAEGLSRDTGPLREGKFAEFIKKDEL